MTAPDLRPDCAACDALCCIALSFDEGAHFAFDKRAGTPCRHLDDASRCRIHPRLARQGMGGCIAYDCKGAGQRVIRELFAHRSWRDGQDTALAMFEAFRRMRTVQDDLELLHLAGRLPLDIAQQAERDRLTGLLARPLTQEGLAEAELVSAEVQAFLRSLAPAARRLTRAG